MQAPEQEVITKEDMERTRERLCFVPKTDIYETEEEIVIIADVPGVDLNSMDITLENNILTINAYNNPKIPEGYELVYSEYDPGDFQRSFRISNEIDGDRIEADGHERCLAIAFTKDGLGKNKEDTGYIGMIFD